MISLPSLSILPPFTSPIVPIDIVEEKLTAPETTMLLAPLPPITLPNIIMPSLESPSVEIRPAEPVEEIPEIVVSSRIIEPTTTLEQITPDPIIGFEQTLPPTVIDTTFSPSVIGDLEGMEDLLTELPNISMPAIPKYQMSITTPQDKINSSLSSAPPKQILASSAIKLPSVLPDNVKTIQPISLPKTTNFKTPPTSKIGSGGLPMDPDMSTLKEVRDFTSKDPELINPDASYQKMIPSRTTSIIPSIPSITILPTIPEISGPSLQPKLPQLPTIKPSEQGLTPGLLSGFKPLSDAQIPTPKTTPLSFSTLQPVIQMPMIKSTAPLPSSKSGIKLPATRTTILPIPLTSPSILLGDTKPYQNISVAYTPEQDLIRNINNINVKKLNTGRGRKGDDTSYTVVELKSIANSINLPKSGSKKDLVSRIKSAVLKVSPHAFDK